MRVKVGAVLSLLFVLAGLGAAATAGDEWELLGEDDGVKVWRKDVDGSPIVAFKGEGLVDASIAKVAQVLDDSARKKEWMADTIEARDVRVIGEGEKIEYHRTAAPWPVKDRDFVLHTKAELKRAEKRIEITIKSTKDPAVPEDEDKAVRGELLASSFTLAAVDEKRTKVIVEIHADPKGSVPKWVVNLVQKSWPRKTIRGVREQAAKPDVGEHPLVKRAFGACDEAQRHR